MFHVADFKFPQIVFIQELSSSSLARFSILSSNPLEKSTHETRKLETSKLIKFKIPVNSIDRQKNILEKLNNLQSKLDLLKRHQAETAAALDALLPAVLERAFRGEL